MKKTGRPYQVTPGDGAFYGPKIDFRVKDAIGPPLAARHDPVRLRAARELRPDLHRRGRQAAPPRHAPPRDPRLARALPRDPHRAHRRQLPVLDRARAGRRAAGLGPVRGEGARSSPRSSRPPACASRSTTATRSSAPASARPRCRRCPACWSWARRRRRPARSPCACATEETPGRCPSTNSSRPPRRRSRAERPELTSEVKDR